MLIQLIIRRFINDYKNVTDKKVRESYAVLSGLLGIICNLSLFILKLIIGLTINSIAVLSDAFNNLSDLGSSLITIFGVKLSNQPPDREHPHGHGRIEYIGALVIAFIIFAVGLQLFRGSFTKILHPETPESNPILMVILLSSIAVKLWMFSYNRYIGGVINSSINHATAYDSLNDVLATSAVIVGVFLSKYVSFPVDGVIGLGISMLIIYTGFTTAKSSVDLLLGSSPDPHLVAKINAMVAESGNIISIHDLRLHDYGPGRINGSLHVVVPNDLDIIEVHSEIDQIEQKIRNELGVDIVIHMDPLDRNSHD